MPDPVHHWPLLGQEAAETFQDQPPVLEEEEHQYRHQHQIDQQCDEPGNALERKRHQPLRDLAHFRRHLPEQRVHLFHGDKLRVFLRQGLDVLLRGPHHSGQLRCKPGYLPPDQRQKPQDEGDEKADEEHEHQGH